MSWLRDRALVAVAAFTLAALLAARHAGTLDGSSLGLGAAPTEVALASGSERLWAASWDRRAVLALDAITGKRLESVHGVRRPLALAALDRPASVAVAGRLGSDLCIIELDPGDGARRWCGSVAGRVPDPNGAPGAQLSPSIVGVAPEMGGRVLVAVAWRSGPDSGLWGLVRLAWTGDRLASIGASPGRALAGRSYLKAPLTSDPATGRAWVAPTSAPQLWALDASLNPVQQAGFPDTPSALAYDPASRSLFVTFESTGELMVLDPDRLEVRRSARLGHAPVALALSPKSGDLLVLFRGDRAIVAVDPATLVERERVVLEGRPWAFVVDGQRDRLWVTEPDLDRVEPCSLAPRLACPGEIM